MQRSYAQTIFYMHAKVRQGTPRCANVRQGALLKRGHLGKAVLKNRALTHLGMHIKNSLGIRPLY